MNKRLRNLEITFIQNWPATCTTSVLNVRTHVPRHVRNREISNAIVYVLLTEIQNVIYCSVTILLSFHQNM